MFSLWMMMQSYSRTFWCGFTAFLTVLKEEWKDMTVGGTLLRQENQRYSFSAGEWWAKGQKPHQTSTTTLI